MRPSIIDTGLAIAFLQGTPEAGQAFERERAAGRPIASAVTVYELAASGGSLLAARLAPRKAFLADIEIAPLSREVAERGGAIVR